jgi:two-component system, cell cycle sensor histidine kinase and response regulator CckA
MTTAKTVLLVEDCTDLRELFAEMLNAAGYSTLSAPDGKAALATASGHPGTIDFLFTDIVMPNMLGTDLASELKRIRPELRVLYMSGYANPAIAGGAPLPPDATLLQKPFMESDLLEKLDELMAEPAQALR